jgi:hypothetical protein
MDEYEYIQSVIRGERTFDSYLSKYRPDSSPESIVCDLLEHGLKTESDNDILCAIACFKLTETFDSRFIDLINNLCLFKWHNRHGDLCSYLQLYGNSESIPYLEYMIRNPPSLYDSSEPFSIGNRCVYAIAYINGPLAIESLHKIIASQLNSIGLTAKRLLNNITR